MHGKGGGTWFLPKKVVKWMVTVSVWLQISSGRAGGSSEDCAGRAGGSSEDCAGRVGRDGSSEDCAGPDGSSEDCAGHAGRDGSSGDCEGVMFVKQMTIAVQEAIVTLYNPPMERAISSPPVKPKGGQGIA